MDSKETIPQTPVPPSLQRKHDAITNLYKDNKDLAPNGNDLQDLHKLLTKQGTSRFDMSMCEASTDLLFKIALEKMETDHDKSVVVGLRAMVRELEDALYRPNARY